jgi:glycosyltransferase involved in cell wall biosynthesis
MNSSSPVVSVIVPSYNCEPYIAQTIDCVLNQTFKDVELIVVDDGSTDRTREIVASYGTAVRLLTQENSRVCAARNRGIQESSGKYICLLDHDDYWFPDKLEQQVQLLEQDSDFGVACSDYIRWYADSTGRYPDPSSFNLAAYSDGIDEDRSGWIYHQFLLDCWMLTSTAMFRHEVFDKCGLFDVSLPFSEDWELWLRISREYPFAQLRRPTTLYRQHSQQASRAVRETDYRTQLLKKAVATWGLCSRDGRCLSKSRLKQQLAVYHAEFGLGQILAGNLKLAIPALLDAWLAQPSRLKYLAYIPAAALGWRPGWGGNLVSGRSCTQPKG